MYEHRAFVPICSSRAARLTARAFLLVLPGFAGCVAYQPQPIDLLDVLRDLEQVELATPGDEAGKAEAAAAPHLTPQQAAAFAVAHNPGLVALRANLGVAEAELARAGLLPDPAFGWDAMDVLAVDLTGGTPLGVDYLAGLGVSWQVPRPGEIDARTGVAAARRDEVRAWVLAAEWRLVREVNLSCLAVEAAEARLQLNAKVIETARRTADFFARARSAGGATAVQESLAGIELASLEQERVKLEGELRTARQEINHQLGLVPDANWSLAGVLALSTAGPAATAASSLVQEALHQRPELRQLLAEYQASEESLRLEVAAQWPQIAIGTGLSIVLPVFSRWNKPAIEAAAARRAQVAARVKAAVHDLRAEVQAALVADQEASRQVQHFVTNLLPRVEASLRLTDQAFGVREVTVVEILTAQRQVLEVQNSYLEARIRAARARLLLDTVTGRVLVDDHGGKEGGK